MDSSHSSARSVVSHNSVSSDVAVGSYVPSGTILNVFAEEIVAYEKDSNETHAVKNLNALSTSESFVTHSNFDTPGGTVYYIPKYAAEAGFVVRRSCQKRMLNGDVKQKKFILHVFDTIHNHELEREEYKHLSKTERQLTYMEQAFIVKAASVNIGATRAHHLLTGDSDAQMLIHKIENRKKHADEVSKYNYREFGDVVSFDTTFNTNKVFYAFLYKMVFVPFIAIDNHRKCVTVAAGLLKNETTKSYIWLLKAFIKAFGKAPSIVITNQDGAMRNAIEAEFTWSKHWLCMWHITQKLPAKVTLLVVNLCSRDVVLDSICVLFVMLLWRMFSMFSFDVTWLGLFFVKFVVGGIWIGRRFVLSRIGMLGSYPFDFLPVSSLFEGVFYVAGDGYGMWHITQKLSAKNMYIGHDEFEYRWGKLMEEFKLENHKWLTKMFDIRSTWILAYFIDSPLCGLMRTTSRLESENSFFSHFINSGLTLMNFMNCFETAMEKQRHVQERMDHKTIDIVPKLKTLLKIERHASNVYTRSLFELVCIIKESPYVYEMPNKKKKKPQSVDKGNDKAEENDKVYLFSKKIGFIRYGEKNVVVENYANEATSIVDHCVHLLSKDEPRLGAFVEKLKSLKKEVEADCPNPPSKNKTNNLEQLVGVPKPTAVDVKQFNCWDSTKDEKTVTYQGRKKRNEH
ncbi:protein FAR1-related sequence 5 [Tanacetum coccineum]